MRSPDFFIIGAMKAATTTLYDDLARHPGIFLPKWKEPGYFAGPPLGGHPKGLYPLATHAQYAALYERAPRGRMCGDGSTFYTKRPTYEGVAQRIRLAGGERSRFIYLVRDPVARTKSQFIHEVQLGQLIAPDLLSAMETAPRLIDYNRYAWQVAPFVELFGADQVLILRFEDYVTNRLATLRRVFAFLGLQPLDRLFFDGARNSAEDRRTPNRLTRYVLSQPWYHRVLRPALPDGVVRCVRALVTKPAPLPCVGATDAEIAAALSTRVSRQDYAIWETGRLGGWNP